MRSLVLPRQHVRGLQRGVQHARALQRSLRDRALRQRRGSLATCREPGQAAQRLTSTAIWTPSVMLALQRVLNTAESCTTERVGLTSSEHICYGTRKQGFGPVLARLRSTGGPPEAHPGGPLAP